jgi:cell division protein FtsI/penicillin-binding protein 2
VRRRVGELRDRLRQRRCPRLDAISYLVFALVLIMGGRLFYLQIIRYPHYRSIQNRQVVSRQPAPARRGRILDRHGRLLAFDSVGYDVSVVPKRVRPADFGLIAEHLGMDADTVRNLIGRSSRYTTIARGVTMTAAGARRLSTLPGVCLERRTYRQYPYGTLAAQVLGFTDGTGRGAEGIEKSYDKFLRGEAGEVVMLKDEDGAPLAVSSRREPVDGADVVLTLDVDLQAIADAELRRSVHDYSAKGGCVLLVDPHHAELLATASAPAPAVRGGDFDPDVWRNRVVTDLFEPGSTLKPLTAIAALRRDIVSFNTMIYAERGAHRFGVAGVVHDAHEEGDGWLTFAQAFTKSSNICFAKVARALPSADLYQELRAFGFGSLTGIDLPGEVNGSLSVPRQWSGRTQLSLGYGHEIGVTAIQMAGLYTAIANGGRLLQPTIASRIVDRDGHTLRRFSSVEIRHPMPPELATQLRELCRLVVDEGTGDAARVDGVLAAGKTGTAQKVVGGQYVSRFVASFCGFVPADDPSLVCLVVLDEPRGMYHWGGKSAAPTFHRIVEGILRGTSYLEPQADRVLLVRGDALDDAPADAAAPQRLSTLEPTALPDLRGQRLQVAARSLRRLGIQPRVVGDGVVTAQWPAPGESVGRGGVVRLRCEPARARPQRAGL